MEQFIEEHRGARGDAAAGRQTCEPDDDREQKIPCRAEEDADRSRENLTAVLRLTEYGCTRCPDVGKRAVNRSHQHDRDETRDETRGADCPTVRDPAHAHGIGNKRADRN